MDILFDLLFNSLEWYHVMLAFVAGGYLYHHTIYLAKIILIAIGDFIMVLFDAFYEASPSSEVSENKVFEPKVEQEIKKEGYEKAKPIFDKLKYLENRLDKLKVSIKNSTNSELDDCKKEMQKCCALAENIKDLVSFQKIDYQYIFNDFQKIREMLVDVEYLIGKEENVWWQRIINKIKVIFQLVSIKLLPPGIGV